IAAVSPHSRVPQNEAAEVPSGSSAVSFQQRDGITPTSPVIAAAIAPAAATAAAPAAATAPTAAAAATTAAVATAAAAAAAAAAARAATPAAAATARRALASFVDRQRAAVQILAVQGADGGLSLLIARDVNEAEAARLTGHPVGHDLDTEGLDPCALERSAHA